MRTAFLNALMAAAERDPRIWLLTGDLGYSVLEPFATRFPDRFINVGIAEQTMTGVAAGLAMAGKVPVTYSIANFPTLRCLEQVRNDICYHRLNVKIVAVGGGMAYGSLGYTHHAVEDLAILRALPDMAVAAPGDPREAATVLDHALRHVGPVYLRLGKAGEPNVHRTDLDLPLGAPAWLTPSETPGAQSERHDVVLVSTGTILPLVADAAKTLRSQGKSVGVVSLPWVSPLPRSVAAEIASSAQRVICIEEHGAGGLFSAFAEALAGTGIPTDLRSVRLTDGPSHLSGTQESLRTAMGLSIPAICAAA